MGDYEDFLKQADDLLLLLDEVEETGFSHAVSFAGDVSKRLESIMEWVEDKEHVTEKQWTALNNWREGAEKWL